MAYALRYYKEIAQTDGGVVRLEIHKKDSTTSAVEIGAVVQGLSLEIQGQQDDIDTPIQKTSLHMTFVDASDIENGQKNGFWQEFYTPDALMWRVILKAKDAGKTSFRTIWGGYVTPDSFSEDLVYRGSVSITARDNIGHMQDFPFDAIGDADGMISLRNLVEAGWEKIQSPMDLFWDGGDWLSCDDVIAFNTLMNVSQFKEMNWYKAIESALASYGAVMRYAGENEVYVTTLRYMPSLGRNIDLMDRIEPTFIAGAQREFVPAVKRIEESVDYELESAPQPLVKASDFSGNSHILDSTNDIYGYSLTNTEEGNGWFNSVDYAAIYFSPSSYIIEDAESEDVESKMYVVAGVGYNNRAEYSRTILAQDITINVTFGTGLMRKRFTDASGRPSGGYYLVPRLGTIFGISYAVYVIQNGVKQYYNFAKGEWEAQATYRREENDGGITEINIPVGLSDYNGNVILGFDFGGIDATIPYINIASVTFSGANELREKNTVNTLYNADNNVILSRDPEIGPAFDKVALPGFIKNGIFYRNGDEILPARLWSWGGSEQQMAVWNHLQLLCYYAKPNNLISGTIVNADITRVAAIYEWGHAEHILVSGRYNFLNGHIEGAVLREFARYEDMWSEVAGAAMPETEQDSRSNVEGGASSSASPSTYTATQNVNIGTGGGGGTGASQLNDLTDVDVTGVVAQSVLYYNGTSWVDMSFASLVNPLLNPYLKSETAKATYATIEALNGLGAAVYTKQETNNLLAKYLLLESANQTIKGNITIEGNLVVRGDTSSTAKGTDSGVAGTLLGIKVNGTTYDKPVNGILTIPDYPTSLAWSAIEGKPTKLSQFTNDAGFITSAALSGYAKKTDIPTSLPASDVYEWAKAATKPSYTKSEVGLGNVENKSSATIRGEITSSNVTNALGYTPANNASLANYLPLSGGTIESSSSSSPLIIKTPSNAWLMFRNASGYLGEYGYSYDKIAKCTDASGAVKIIIHDGNIGSYKAGSATKLATARTIWGQSFDGTGNVSGSFYINNESPIHIYDSAGTGRNALYLSGGNNLWIGYGTSAAQYNTIIAGYNTSFRYGGNSNTAIFINSSGNVGIGTTSPAFKLDVNGGVRMKGTNSAAMSAGAGSLVVMDNTGAMLMFDSNDIQSKNSDGVTASKLYINDWGGDLILCGSKKGNVGIGVPSPSAPLHVAGNAIITGDTSTGSDIRFKDKLSDHRIALSDIADAPLFTFKWNDREDDSVHLGSSAQYWEKVAPWLVKGEDFKTLDYSTLGVAIGISLANKTLNLEDRVKILEKENKALKEQIRRIQYGS